MQSFTRRIILEDHKVALTNDNDRQTQHGAFDRVNCANF